MAFAHPAVAADAGVVADSQTLVDRLHVTVATAVGVDAASISDQSSPDTIAEWDSLNHLTMAMAVEGEFGIAFTADEVLEMRDIGCVRAALRAHDVEI